MIKRIACLGMVACMSMSTMSVNATEVPYTLPKTVVEEQVNSVVDKSGDINEAAVTYTAQEAAEYALEFSPAMEYLRNQVQLASVGYENAKETGSDLKSMQRQLDSASSLVVQNEQALTAGQAKLDAAQKALDMNVTPVDIPLTDSSGKQMNDPYGNPIIITAGTNIKNFLTGLAAQLSAILPDGTPLPVELQYIDATTQAIKSGVQKEFDKQQLEIDQGHVALKEGTTTLDIKKDQFELVMNSATSKIESKINYNSSITMDADDAKQLMVKMADVNLNVTRYAERIYKNQLAMLVKKNYYDALYAKKDLDLKSAASQRGRVQYEMLQLSYDNGMKAKDDLLLSKMFYDGKMVELRLAEATYNNALYELKKNMGLDMNFPIILVDDFIVEETVETLDESLHNGLTKRIEIQQSLGEVLIHELNLEILEDMYQNTGKQYPKTEAYLLLENSRVQLDRNIDKVSSEIHQSYELMLATAEMLEQSSSLVAEAEEVLAIAQLKYDQGFGSANSLLKTMNLESSSGTMIELMAAQENLIDMEAKVANIRYNYTMARIKFLNDSAILSYE